MSARVLHVSTVHPPFDSRIFEKEVRSLCAAGYRLSVAMTVEESRTVDGIRVLPLGDRRGSRVRRIGRNARALWWMLKERYDVIHIHDPELLLTTLIPLARGSRIIYDVHEFYAERIAESSWIPRALRRLAAQTYRAVEHLLLPAFAGAVVVSEAMIPRYSRILGADRVALVRNYPLISEAQRADLRATPRPLAEPYIVHTGGASHLRAFDVMVAAAERLRAMGERAPLVNLGPVDLSAYPPDERRALMDRASAADVRLLGEVPYRDALRWVAHARVGYILLQKTQNNERGSPNKLFEYLCFGLPVVTPPLPSASTIIGESGCALIVSPDDAEQHAVALHRLCTDDGLHAAMSEAAAQAGRACTFGPEARTLERLYGRIVARGRLSRDGA
jgi:glycosyltransferase involved in cell wall biosynthesis